MNLNEIETITLEEAANRYPSQWLGAKVIRRDEESGQPMEVKVLSRNVDMLKVRNAIGVDDVCTFYTGSIPEARFVMMY